MVSRPKDLGHGTMSILSALMLVASLYLQQKKMLGTSSGANNLAEQTHLLIQPEHWRGGIKEELEVIHFRFCNH